jgi:hypothetical protein
VIRDRTDNFTAVKTLRRKSIGSRLVWLSWLVVFLSISFFLSVPFANAQIESGTVVIIGYSTQKVIVAADSRETNPLGAYRDQACKIAALNDRLMITVAGQARSVLGDTVQWDAIREARTALTDTQRLDTDTDGDFLDRVARRWGILLGTNMSNNMQPNDVLKLANDQELINGMFIGLDEKQELHISHEIIRAKIVDSIPHFNIDPVKVVTIPDNIIFRALGEGDISDEFESGRTARSKHWKLKVSQFGNARGLSKEAAEAILRVDLTGAYGKENIPNNPAVHLVGGKTDAAELKRGGTIHWIQRKPQCPEN